MRVYKATDQDMSCHMGNGKFQYELGTPMKAERSRCGSTGLHACEYVIDCARYYPIESSRFFMAYAGGDIAEDGENTRIACTELTLITELRPGDIIHAALSFMISHPRRGGWECRSGGCIVGQEAVESSGSRIVIARGKNPRVKAPEGAWVGMLKEVGGKAVDVGVFRIGGKLNAHEWYDLETARKAVRG